MTISATKLARLLREAHHDAAATAVEAGDSKLVLWEGHRHSLRAIYRVRESIQAKAGRVVVAAEIHRLVDALREEQDQRVYGGSESGGEHYYLVFLNATADAVLGVITPPRKPDGTVDDPGFDAGAPAALIETQRSHRDRQAAESPRRCSSRRRSGADLARPSSSAPLTG